MIDNNPSWWATPTLPAQEQPKKAWPWVVAAVAITAGLFGAAYVALGAPSKMDRLEAITEEHIVGADMVDLDVRERSVEIKVTYDSAVLGRETFGDVQQGIEDWMDALGCPGTAYEKVLRLSVDDGVEQHECGDYLVSASMYAHRYSDVFDVTYIAEPA